jgi:hypothetical protein
MANFITKSQYFGAIATVIKNAMAEGADIEWGSVEVGSGDKAKTTEITSEDVLTFLDKQIELADRKKSSSSARTSAKAEENKALAEQIAEYLTENGKMLGKAITKEFDLSPSKLTAIAKVGGFAKEKTKDGVAYFIAD